MPETLGRFWNKRRRNEINRVLTALAAKPLTKREIMMNAYGFLKVPGGPEGELMTDMGKRVTVHQWNTDFFAQAGRAGIIKYDGEKYVALVPSVETIG